MDVLKALATHDTGLLPRRRSVVFIFTVRRSPGIRAELAWHTLAAQFKNVLVVILLVATLLSGLLGHGLEAAVIAVIVLFAVLLGFIQEYRAERALEALREMAPRLATRFAAAWSWRCPLANSCLET